MTTYWLTFTLKSDATFGRGEGVPGLVDEEVEHDQYGLPFLRGRTLKGLLVEECANLLYAAGQQASTPYAALQAAADRLFGTPGTTGQVALMRVGDARLPADLRQMVEYQIQEKQLQRSDVLESLTDIRRQTSVNEITNCPEEGSLRAIRVILRETPFEASLQFQQPPATLDLALLSACILAFRRAGTGRNRGRGRLQARLRDENQQDITKSCFDEFKKVMQQ